MGAPPRPARFAAIGAGFWARYQLSAWRDVQGAECVALCDVDRGKAERLARDLGIPAAYDDPDRMLREVRPDFADVITGPATHAEIVRLAAARGTPVIVQKPMAESLAEAEDLVRTCRERRVPFFVHENWRWQAPIRELKRVLDTGSIGAPFRARIRMVSGFPVFVNQPYLKDLERFILADMGVHVLDVARFLFGEASSLYARTQRVHRDIRGEDVATVVLAMRNGMTVTCEMGYAENHLEQDRFPETFVIVEAERGSAELAPDFWVRVTTRDGTHARRCPPPRCSWADPAYDVVHASMVPCNASLLRGARGEGGAETTGEDNLRTLRLVFGAYESAADDRVVPVPP
ncbi:MAG: Gfo/Idh/MocA family oxidoreductase [Planctomycetes bacterium]|nr:Gfo/Idh/MocA family oxidoreductase [Planctomycetota bacterium]